MASVTPKLPAAVRILKKIEFVPRFQQYSLTSSRKLATATKNA